MVWPREAVSSSSPGVQLWGGVVFWTLIDITARKGLCQTYDRPEIISATTAVKVAEAE